MHHALEIQEILFNIFGHCDFCTDLASLARTCRAFKDPALDVLWEELDDLVPLELCLPEASLDNDKYLFNRPLTQNDWDILQSYTRRIRRIKNFGWAFDEESIEVLSNPPTTEPLFPNLRRLYCKDIVSIPLLHLPFPSLVSLALRFLNPYRLQGFLESFSEYSPNISTLFICTGQSDVTLNTLVSNCICRWRDLQKVDCPEITLDVDTLVHLSRMPALTELCFKQPVTLPDCVSPLFFRNLHRLTLRPASLSQITQLLSQIRLPAIKEFDVSGASCPSRQELSSFLAGVRIANAEHTIECFTLFGLFPSSIVRSEALLLCSANLRSCMAFNNLRRIHFNIRWSVSLTDSELLSLASAWPNLECLVINSLRGWNTLGGITPNGLLRLLQKCLSLYSIYLVMDTRGYTELPPANLGSALRPRFYLDVLDSIIEAESVPAIAAFFASVASSCSDFSLQAWSDRDFVKPPDWEVYNHLWKDVGRRVKDAIGRR